MVSPKPINHDLQKRDRLFRRRAALIITAAMVAVVLFCLLMGRYNCSRFDVLKSFMRGIIGGVIRVLELPSRLIPGISYSISNPIAVSWNKNVDSVVWMIRIPRIVAALFVGGGLAMAGTSYQSLFRNPLVSESILGVSAGASLGASIGILVGTGDSVVTVFAFIGGILAVACTYLISSMLRGNQTLLLVLAGSVVSSIFSAGLSIVKYIAPQDSALPLITFWLMGSFAKISSGSLVILVPVILVCSLILFFIRWQMNALALGDSEARTLGVNVKLTRLVIIICSTLIAAVSVCVCGMIGWVGVIIPQITRMIVGSDSRRLVPCAFFSGAFFMVIVDLLCRNVLVAEIPVGIVTSLVGAPIFVVILKRSREGWL